MFWPLKYTAAAGRADECHHSLVIRYFILFNVRQWKQLAGKLGFALFRTYCCCGGDSTGIHFSIPKGQRLVESGRHAGRFTSGTPNLAALK